MSSSRSDVVTKSVSPFVRSFVRNLFFYSVFGVWCFKEVSRVFQRSFKCNSRKFQVCFKEVSRVLQGGSLKEVSRKFEGCFKEV